MKVAFSGSSGSGKTTMVQFVAEQFNLKHISGSAGDLKTEADKLILQEEHGYPGGGHSAVIKYSALNPEYGIINQEMLLARRTELIKNNPSFVTDRSPADNIVYFLLQVGYHPMLTDAKAMAHMKLAQEAWDNLTHVIYIKAVQPGEVERNHSRVDNKYFQKHIVDPAFSNVIQKYLIPNSVDGPGVLVINYWDLQARKEAISAFLSK